MITKTSNGWQVNIQPGGRAGRRVRRLFRLKEHADAFIRNQYIQIDRAAAGLSADISMGELIDRFINDYASIRFRGFKFERYRLLRLKKHFDTKKLSQLSLADAIAYINQQKTRGMSDGTLGRDTNSMKRLTSWAVENDFLPFDPWAKLKRIKSGKRTRWLTEQESEQVLLACKQFCPEIHNPVAVALLTGFRLSNILELKAEDFEDQIVWARKTKSGKPYAVPIDPRLKSLIASGIFKSSGLLFSAGNLERKFRMLMIKIGFHKGKNNPNTVVFHTLRHTFGAYWLNHKVPIYTVSQWLGHSSVSMTEQVYAHLSLQHHVEMMQISDLGRQSVDTQIIPFPEKPSVSSCPHGESNPSFGLERDKK